MNRGLATFVVELTPPGRGAIAVVLLDGPAAREAIRRFFRPVTAWRDNDPPTGRIVLGRWGSGNGEELIICRRGDQRFEIHCHGGGAAATAIARQLVSHGCQAMTWQEWVRHSTRDSLRGAAQVALASAPTFRTAAVLLDQYHGALSNAILAVREAIGHGNWSRAGELLDGILQHRAVGLHLTSPWRVVLAGPPNVGKSSLINAIAGYQRAIVSPTPGTTRDVVTVDTAIDGWPVKLADTAGLRRAEDELEQAGVSLANAVIREADLVVAVSDAIADVPASAEELMVRLPESVRVVPVWNKIDLLTKGELAGKRALGQAPPTADGNRDSARGNPQSTIHNPKLVSALTGEGIADLIAAIGSTLVPCPPPPDAAVAFTREQIGQLENAREAVREKDAAQATTALTALLAPD
jgi:tRNA modification GTPase